LDFISVFLDQAGDFIQLVRAEIAGLLQLQRPQPKLSVSALFSNMDMGWLATVQTEKEDRRVSLPRGCNNHDGRAEARPSERRTFDVPLVDVVRSEDRRKFA
jgi:hypothetical protein